MGNPETVLADGLDIFRPRIDVRHILAGLHHVRARIAADRSCADDCYLLLLRHYVFSRIRLPAPLAACWLAILIRLRCRRHPIALAEPLCVDGEPRAGSA